MDRRQTLASLAAVSLVGAAMPGRIIATLSDADSFRKHVRKTDSTELEACLRECIRLCNHSHTKHHSRFSTLIQTTSKRSDSQLSGCRETAVLCQQALQRVAESRGQDPAFWQACADACHRCITESPSAELTRVLETTGALCSSMVI